VEISGLSIESVRTGVPVEKVLWSDLQEVHIVNEDAWPIGTQYWLLIGRNRTGAVVPSDAGAQELLVEMQKRLPGFDNRALIVAMGELSGSARIWPAASDDEGTD
jgi:hypothetical protein